MKIDRAKFLREIENTGQVLEKLVPEYSSGISQEVWVSTVKVQ